MKVSEAIERRRSIKYFDPDERMPAGHWQQLQQLARRSPTAFNIQNWRFVRVQDAVTRRKIRAAAWDQPQMTDAALLLVICFDRLAWQREPARYWANAPADVAAQLVPEITGFYAANEQLQRDEGLRSCGIAAQTLMLAAQELGYESCALDGFDFAEVGRLIHLPADHEIALILTIGTALKPAHARPGDIDAAEIFFDEQFPVNPESGKPL